MRRLLLALLFALLPSWAMGAVTYDAVSSGSAASGSSLTFSHTVTGTNVVLYCGVGWQNGVDFTMAMTYNGAAMSSIAKVTGNDGSKTIEVFRLIAPATGAHNAAVTVSGGVESFVAGCISFAGAHQTTPEGTVVTNSDALSETITVPTSGAGLSFLYYNQGGGACDADPVSAQTERFDLCDGNFISDVAGSTTTSTGSVNMSWTLTIDGGLYRMIVAVPVAQSTGVAAATLRRKAIRLE